MSQLFSTNNPVVHCAPKRVRRTWWGTVLTVLTMLALAALCGWLLHLMLDARCAMLDFRIQNQGLVAMAPVWAGPFAGALAMAVVVIVVLAVRKVRADDVFYASLREGELEGDDWQRVMEERVRDRADVFAPLRSPGEPVPPDDAQRILVACAAEARCIAKHVERARRHLSVEDYGEELTLAAEKIDAVIRCVEALAARMTNGECGMPNDGRAKARAANTEWPSAAEREDAS